MTIYSHIRANIVRSYSVFGVFIGFVVALAYILSQANGYGSSFVVPALLLSILSSVGSFYFGDKIILSMSGARPATRNEHFDFYTVCENLSLAAGIPMPKLYVIDDPAMNAFATGRDPQHAVVCATTGLLERMDRREIEGVVAHELSHVKNYDIRLMLLVGVLAGTVVYISDFFLRTLWWGNGNSRDDRDSRDSKGIFFLVGLVLAFLSPFLATLMKLALSRNREYLADASGALLTRYPEGLARALEKISKDPHMLEQASNATAHLYIENPFSGKKAHAVFSSLFDTHPPVTERIKRLRSM